MPSDLSDVLRDMAEDRRDNESTDASANEPEHGDADVEPTDHDPNQHPDHHPNHDADHDSDHVDELAEIQTQIGDESGASIGTSPMPAARSAARRGPGRGFQATAVPVLMTVGLILVGLGVWGTAVLSGAEVVLSDRPRADTMALGMILAGYPLGGALLAGAAFFLYQLRKR